MANRPTGSLLKWLIYLAHTIINLIIIVLGRGGSDGCAVPMNIERLNTLGVVQVECGAQFSLALTRDGEVSRIKTSQNYLSVA